MEFERLLLKACDEAWMSQRNAIPPTYAPPRPPPTGKPLTKKQKILLGATILLLILAVALITLLLGDRIRS